YVELEAGAGTAAAERKSLKRVLNVLSGPALFALTLLLPMGSLPSEGQFVLATYAWVLAWWVGRPIPWTITGLLPLVLFPVVGLMSFRDTMLLYGQPVLPFL